MTGIYISLMSGLIEIFGWDMMLMAMSDAEEFGEVTNRYASWIQQYFNALADSKAPCVMIHDDIVWTSGPFTAPSWYREFIFPNYKKLFAPLHESGKKLLYTSDGDYTMFIDDIAKVGVNGFVMEPMTDMKYIADNYGKTHAFIGNADTRILLSGTKEEIRAEVQRCMDSAKNAQVSLWRLVITFLRIRLLKTRCITMKFTKSSHVDKRDYLINLIKNSDLRDWSFFMSAQKNLRKIGG